MHNSHHHIISSHVMSFFNSSTFSQQLLSRSLSENGETFYEFKTIDQKIQKSVAVVSMQLFENKGLGLRINDARKKGSSILHTGALVSICIVSKNRMQADNSARMCPVCYHATAKRAFKSSEDNELLCSKECLQWYSQYYSCCGKMLRLIASLQTNCSEQQRHYVDIHSLLLKYLYITTLLQQQQSLSATNNAMIIQLQNVFELFQPSEVNTEDLEQATWFHSNVVHLASDLFAMLPARWKTVGDCFYKLVHVFRYNAQPLPVLGLQHCTEILCILPPLARLNHSCAPNCRLVFTLVKRKATTSAYEARVRVTLQAMRDIAEGEELTISYLRNDFHKPALRQKLLLESFRFSCQCERCVAEKERSVRSASPSQGRLEVILHRAALGENVSEEICSSLPQTLTCCRKVLDEYRNCSSNNPVAAAKPLSNQRSVYAYDAHDTALLLLSAEGDIAQKAGMLVGTALRAACAVIVCDCLHIGGASCSDGYQRYALIGAQSMLRLLLQSGGRAPIAGLCPEGSIDLLVTQVRSHLDRALVELQLLSTACASDLVRGEEEGETQLGRVDVSSGNYYRKVLQQGTKLCQQFAELLK